MSAHGAITSRTSGTPEWTGVAAAVLGSVALVAVSLAGAISFTPLNPPGWARITVIVLLAGGWLGSVVLGIVGYFGQARTSALVGLALWGIATVIIVAMVYFGG